MKIILVSRTLSKLEKVAKEIKDSYRVETAVIDVDFTSGPEIYDKIKDRIKGKEIGVLVNNVGMFYSVPSEFLAIPNREKMIQDIVSCNISSVPMMCSIVMPQMVLRKKGIVINLSSISALVACPSMAIYSASKAFVNKFNQDLAAEYENQGIIIQSVLPGPVATNMTRMKKGSFFAPTATDYVNSAIKTVGFTDSTTGYWVHSVLVLVSNAFYFLFPKLYALVQRKVSGFVMSNSIFEEYSKK
jgi:17beta-estradiol 17-dehydrogenase / very-long-chain 3-oxoacyl-CoA reductase